MFNSFFYIYKKRENFLDINVFSINFASRYEKSSTITYYYRLWVW